MKINVDNEKAKFKTRLESSFDEISLSDQGFLKKMLERKRISQTLMEQP